MSELEAREWTLMNADEFRCAEAGSAVIYSTHYMEEAERICDRVFLIDRGKMIADGSLEELIALGVSRIRMELTIRGVLPADWSRDLAEVRIAESDGEGKLTLED